MTEQRGNTPPTNPQPRHRFGRFAGSAKAGVIILAAALAGTAGISAGRADQADAKRLFKAMSDYLAAQKAISFDYDVNLELVSTQQQKVALASSGTLTLDRTSSDAGWRICECRDGF
jgi:hypothetical protein